jgi:uncharacterized protein YjbI with pentapeptide repeats
VLLCEATIPADTLECPGCGRKRQFHQGQYDILRRCSEASGTAEWDAWREAHPGEEVMLEAADLAGAQLWGANLRAAGFCLANLSGAELRGASLAGANLRSANLEGAGLRDARMQGVNLRGANLRGTDLRDADLEGAHLSGADLKDANLRRARLPGTDLRQASLEGTLLENADLRRADLRSAKLAGTLVRCSNLEGADLTDADLGGAQILSTRLAGVPARGAAVDGRTRLWGCTYDGQTDFTGVGLASACIEPGLRTALERNVRRIGWEKWYGSTRLRRWVLRWPVQAFWWASDYGSSTARIFVSLLLLSLVFAGVYYWSGLAAPPGPVTNLFEADGVTVPHLLVPLRAVYFSVVTMTTLGFGDVNAEPTSYLGHVLLMVQVVLGYVLLGALVTRFAIMFQGGTVPLVPGPGPEAPREAGDGDERPG